MNTELPPPPPTTTPSASVPAIERAGRLSHPVALFAVATVIGLAMGLVLGFGVGWVVATTANADCSPQDTWCEVGGAIVGLLIGGALGVITYITTGVTTIVRCRSAGRTRTLHILAHLAVIPGLPLALTIAANILP